jgi:hypothetical protein
MASARHEPESGQDRGAPSRVLVMEINLFLPGVSIGGAVKG